MKRGILILVVILLLIPLASAKVNINVDKEQYNLGDKIILSGSIYEGKSITGYLKLSVNCGDDSLLMQLVPLTIKKETEIEFPKDFDVPEITISSAMHDTCSVMGEVITGDEVIDRGFSDSFEVTKEIEGKFTLRETLIQVGSIINIIGEVTKFNNDPIYGIADIYFTHGDSRYLIEVISIEDGYFNYSYTTTATPAGTYSIDIVVHELYGNEMLFEDVADFELVNQFSVIVGLNSRTFLPGEELEISGEVKDVKSALVDSASVSILIDGISYPTTVSDGLFSYSIDLPESIKSGKHKVEVIVEDDRGNTGSAVRYIEATAVPTILKANVPEVKVLPGTEIMLVPALYDQADDVIDTMVEILIKDAKGNEVIKTTVSSGEELPLTIPDLTEPGEWEIGLKANDMETEEKFEVGELYLLSAVVKGDTLTIKNVGNVKQKGKFEIGVIGEEGEEMVSTRKSIKPGEELEIELSKELDTGNYRLFVPTGNTTKRIDNVKVTKSQFKFEMKYLYYLLIIIGLALLAVLIFIGGKRLQGKSSDEEYSERPRPSRPASVKSALQKELESPDIEDFRKRMLASIRETEPDHKPSSHRSSYVERREAEKKKKGGNAFSNMFA